MRDEPSHPEATPTDGGGAAAALPVAKPIARPIAQKTPAAPQPANLPSGYRVDASENAVQIALHTDSRVPALPSWLASLVVHLTLIILLGLLYLPSEHIPPLGLQAQLTDYELEPLEEQVVSADVSSDDLEVDAPTDQLFAAESEALAEPIDAAALSELAMDSPPMELSSFAPEGLLESIGGGSDFSAGGFDARGAASRARMVRRGGGTTQSEKSVEESLNWLARHQHPDGYWSFDHRHEECGPECDQPGNLVTGVKGATGLALLPFLGAGNTPLDGAHKRVVDRGVQALVMMMEPTRNGGSFIDGGEMYSHGIASMALCEAYAMTGDESLRLPAQAALNFICYAQDPDGGGWRYQPRQRGDTSVMGWQVGALKSGYLADLLVPPVVPAKASYFLDSVQLDDGEAYSYEQEPSQFRPATTAIGLLCRMYLGVDHENEILGRGVERLAKLGPSKTDAYFNYYATQVIFQYTSGKGDLWKKWNAAMRDMLIAGQQAKGEAKGSWAPGDGDHGKAKGGRLYATALNCMTLEVYYRLLPIYQTQAFEDGFEED
jgi:hypothetical protein